MPAIWARNLVLLALRENCVIQLCTIVMSSAFATDVLRYNVS